MFVRNRTLVKACYSSSIKTDFARSVCVVYEYPHIYIRDMIEKMPKKDLERLEEDFGKWVGSDPILGGSHARFKYALPGFYVSDNGKPDDVTELHNHLKEYDINGDDFMDHGKRIAACLMQMINVEIKNGNEEYFKTYHNLICFQNCRDRMQCISRRSQFKGDYKEYCMFHDIL